MPQFPFLKSGLTYSELQAQFIVGQYNEDNQQCFVFGYSSYLFRASDFSLLPQMLWATASFCQAIWLASPVGCFCTCMYPDDCDSFGL